MFCCCNNWCDHSYCSSIGEKKVNALDDIPNICFDIINYIFEIQSKKEKENSYLYNY